MLEENFRNIEYSEFQDIISPFDVILVKKYPRIVNWVISFGQKLMLKRMGLCNKGEASVLGDYIHVFQVIDPKTSIGVEALYPAVSEITLRKYCGKKLEILKLVKYPDKDTSLVGIKKERELLNVEYDYKEYIVYPFYMVFGTSPYFWKKLWNDANKPVCSSLAMMILQSMGIGNNYKNLLETFPARMPLMKDIFVSKDKVIVNMPPIETRKSYSFPYWFGF